MTKIIPSTKAASVNPLRSSQPLGAAFAFLGISGSVPLFHGSQGCTSFALVLFVRHFKEAIPLQTTAMDEVATIIGGADNLEEAILNLKRRTGARFIGVCTTALVETRGEDFAGEIAAIKVKRAEELAGTDVVLVQTPDFDGAIEEGWSKAVTAVIDALVEPAAPHDKQSRRINVLPGWHLTVADIELLRETVEAFGLEPVILPDVSGALDGTIPDRWIPTTYGGTRVDQIRDLGTATHTIAIGEHMRKPARLLFERTGVPFAVFDGLTTLRPIDKFIALLAEISGKPVPAKIRRRRDQLTDAMLDGHFYFSGKRIAIGAEPDHLFALADVFSSLGAEVSVAVTTSGHSAVLTKVNAGSVKVGDLRDLEDLASRAACDLLVTHSHGRQAADRLAIPLLRVGFPIFDRIGGQHKRTILYEGARDFIFEVANVMQSAIRTPMPDDLNPFLQRSGEKNDEYPLLAPR